MFKKMEYVYAVYKERSFTKAAEKLYISQPCLSAAIKKLEDMLGMPLFERRYSSIQPTEIGFEYIAAVEKIMNIKNGFAEKVNAINNLEYGGITIGGSNYISSYLLPRIVSKFTELHPKIEISLMETSSVELDKKLNSEDIDLMIDSFDDEDISHQCTPLLNEKILLAVHANSKCNAGLEEYRIMPDDLFNTNFDFSSVPQISIKKFKDEKFILLKNGHNMYKHASKVFKESGFTPQISFRLDQLLTSYALAASNNGVCFVTDTLFKYHRFRDNVVLYNIKGSGSRTLYIAQKNNRFTTHAMSEFINISKKALVSKNDDVS